MNAYILLDDLPPGQQKSFIHKVCGVPIIERQIRSLVQMGIENIFLISTLYRDDIQIHLTQKIFPKRLYRNVHLRYDSKENLPEINRGGLFLSAYSLLDKRILAALDEDHYVRHTSGSIIAANISEKAIKASENISSAKDILNNIKNTDGMTELNLDNIPVYDKDCRREIPLMNEDLNDNPDMLAINEQVLASAQKGTLDWPARYIHPFFENFTTRRIWNTSITPNQITVLSGLFGLYLIYLMATGSFMAALIGIVVMGVFDGVDGKLARTKMLTSKIGELEHTMDKILEYGWYLALGYALSVPTGDWTLFYFSCGTVGFLFIDMLLGSYFKAKENIQLDDIGPFERKFRLIGGRRNTHFWTLIPFGIAGAWAAGNIMMCVYAGMTFFVRLWRAAVYYRNK